MSDSDRPKGKKSQLYDDPDSDKNSEIRYEISVLPLQEHVAVVRKVVSGVWKDAKVQWRKLSDTVNSSISTTRSKTHAQLQSIGVKNPALVVKAGAIGSAGLIGLLFARKRSLFVRVLYPTLAGGAVWSAYYCSTAENRSYIKKQMMEIQSGYLENKSNKK